MRHTPTLLSGLLLTGLTTLLSGQNLVNWASNSYVTGTTFDWTNPGAPWKFTTFSDTEERYGVPGDYKDPGTGVSYNFFGGVHLPGETTNNGAQFMNDNAWAGGMDVIRISGGTTTPNIGAQVGGVFIFKKEHFLNAQTPGDLFFSVHAANMSSWDSNNELRFLIKSGGSYYVSNSFSFAGTTSVPAPAKIEATSDSLSWFAYDPATSMYVSDAVSATPSLENVDAVGVQLQSFGKTAINNRIAFGNFQVSVVPEPGALAALAGSLALFLAIRRRARL